MTTTDYEMGCKTFLLPAAWRNATPEIIGRVLLLHDSALRRTGVRTVYHAAPVHIEAYVDDEGHEWPEGWELNASGISLCRRDGHAPYDDGFRDFMCSRCGEIVDRAAYEAIAGVT